MPAAAVAVTSPLNSPLSPIGGNKSVFKYRAEFNFDASRDDELTIKIGDTINVSIQLYTYIYIVILPLLLLRSYLKRY